MGHDPGVFFPIGDSGAAAEQVRAAKRVCSSCTVREPCLDWAVRTGVTDGVFGGLDQDERRGIRARRARRSPRSTR